MLQKVKTYIPLAPILGLCIYVVLYTLGSFKYNGGSFNLPNAQGYSFFHNLLCDLMLPLSINGQINAGRPLGILSHIILSLAMMMFFFFLPEIFPKKNLNTRMTRYIGILAMLIFAMLFSEYHDFVVLLTGIVGTAALIPFFIELNRHSHIRLKKYAYFCFFMSVIVLLSFLTKIGYYYLPILQKVVFAIDAIWVIWVCMTVHHIYRLDVIQEHSNS